MKTPFLCRRAVRMFLLDYAKQTRAHQFSRVSNATLERINETVRQKLVAEVRQLPSKGKTI